MLSFFHHLSESLLLLTDKTVTLMRVDYDMKLPPSVLVLMKKVCRGLRVLEHVTACNEGNQKSLTQHQGEITSVYSLVYQKYYF